jgi:hypothetical protein
MALSTSTLIDRLGDHLAATLPTSPEAARWTRSRFLPPSLGQDTEAKIQRCWSVWSPGASPVAPTQRQTPTEGVHVTSVVEAGFSYSLRQDGTAADYTNALTAEDTFRAALFGVDRTTLPRFTLQSVSRTLQPDGRTLVILLTLSASHTVALTP